MNYIWTLKYGIQMLTTVCIDLEDCLVGCQTELDGEYLVRIQKRTQIWK